MTPPPSDGRRTRVQAPAKVNLGLRIVGRRDDGYHELDSLFVPLDLADEVEVELCASGPPGVSLALAGAADALPAGGDNLAARAAELFLGAAGLDDAGVRLRLTKRVPVAAGLGGGSSDAAAVLRGLSEFRPGSGVWLAEVALALGADVPFFLDPRPARVTGIGERVEPLAAHPPLVLLLANPGVALATAEVYGAYDAMQPAPPPPAAPLPGHPGIDLGNDLEPAAVQLCPPIGRLCERLRETAPLGVGLSGSGATVFGVYPDRAAAEAAERQLGLSAPAWSRVTEASGAG